MVYLVVRTDYKRRIIEAVVCYNMEKMENLVLDGWLIAGAFDLLAYHSHISERKLDIIIMLLEYNMMYKQINMKNLSSYFEFATLSVGDEYLLGDGNEVPNEYYS